MSKLNQTDLSALQATAATAAAYLDACDGGARFVRLDPEYYRACANLLLRIFAVANPYQAFPILIEQSAAARDVAESIEIGHRLEVSRLGYYPHLAAVLNRVSI